VAGLYIHVPYHKTSHRYDDAYTVDIETADVSAFVDALQRELRSHARAYAQEEPVRTIYAGGGRPSLLSRRTVRSLLLTVVDVFDASSFEEATAELNPADATPAYLHALRRMGFDRLSLQGLSFFPEDLRAVGAPHSAEDVIRALRMAREAGFDDLSLDLCFGWPDQPLGHWRAVLQMAAEMDLPHLTISEVPSSTGPVAAEDARAHCLEFAMTFLQSKGYEQYELTHFARPGHRSVYQEQFYDHGNYLGLGPSAESFWWADRSRTAARRWANVSDLDEYAALLEEGSSPVAFREALDRAALAEEYVLLRLRTLSGIDLDLLADRYGVNLRSEHGGLLDRLEEENRIHLEDGAVRLTNEGRLVADAITERLLPSR
jgi:oxygen-independent coproporphyrinogen-3 oxidase